MGSNLVEHHSQSLILLQGGFPSFEAMQEFQSLE